MGTEAGRVQVVIPGRGKSAYKKTELKEDGVGAS